MRVHVLGVRGSTPAPGRDFAGVGGHTSCVAVVPDDDGPMLVLDAGTGLRRLDEVLGGRPFRGAIALTHLHWDHLMGLPFCEALGDPAARVDLLLPSGADDPGALLDRILGPPFFPIRLSALAGRIRVRRLDEGTYDRDGLRLDAAWVPHGGSRALGFRVAGDGRSLAYLPDHGVAQGRAGPEALALCRGADVVVHDAQFAPGEEDTAALTGHCTTWAARDLAERAGAARLLLAHHHPRRTDAEVARLAEEAASARTSVEAACEGMVLTLG